MSRSKGMMQEIGRILNDRITDSLSISASLSGDNPLQLISDINHRENSRLRRVIKLQILLNDTVKEETNEAITEAGKYLYGISASILRLINENFKAERTIRHDYTCLVSLFRKYFQKSNDIRMVTRLEELFKSKSIKKPIILTKLVKILVDITRNFLSERLREVNLVITESELEVFQLRKRQTLREVPSNDLRQLDKKNKPKINCPIFLMQPMPKAFEAEEPFAKPDQIRFGSLLAYRNKLREKWKDRPNNENYFGNENINTFFKSELLLKKSCVSGTPIHPFKIAEPRQCSEPTTQKDLNFPEPPKPQTSHIFRRGSVRTSTIKERGILSSDVEKRLNRAEKHFGVGCYLQMLGFLSVDERFQARLWAKKSKKFFDQIQLKELMFRNRDIQREILKFGERRE